MEENMKEEDRWKINRKELTKRLKKGRKRDRRQKERGERVNKIQRNMGKGEIKITYTNGTRGIKDKRMGITA